MSLLVLLDLFQEPLLLPLIMASQTRSAVIVKTAGNAVVESGVKVPKLQAGDILIRTTAVALNPVDHAFIDYMAQPGAVQGCDYAVRKPPIKRHLNELCVSPSRDLSNVLHRVWLKILVKVLTPHGRRE